MKTCTICYRPLPEKIDQYGPMNCIVCRDCFHLDSEHNLPYYTLDELRNGDHIIVDLRDVCNLKAGKSELYSFYGYTHLPRPYNYELPLFTFGITYQHTKPIITQYVARKQTQRQRAKRKKVYV